MKSEKSEFLSVAVPSRLKRLTSSPSIFSGLRVAFKDNIHFRDVKTSMGNRSFYNTLPPQSKTADCIQKLIDGGAVPVGKNASKKDRDEGFAGLEVFRRWFTKHFLATGNANVLFVIPIEGIVPRYRDAVPT